MPLGMREPGAVRLRSRLVNKRRGVAMGELVAVVVVVVVVVAVVEVVAAVVVAVVVVVVVVEDELVENAEAINKSPSLRSP